MKDDIEEQIRILQASVDALAFQIAVVCVNQTLAASTGPKKTTEEKRKLLDEELSLYRESREKYLSS